MSFEQLDLDPRICKAVRRAGFQAPTAIQSQSIPVILSGGDLMASAQTGTGKTAAFVLPTLQRLLSAPRRGGIGPRALVLTPTRELAMQVGDAVAELGALCDLSTGNLVGGMSYRPQYRLLGKRLDILVATPGRLMDHMDQGRVDFSRLEILILDEADRMLDMGFIQPVRTIAAALPAARQTLLFSATLEGSVQTLAGSLLKHPQRVQLAHNQARHAGITQRLYQADDAGHKRRLLDHLLIQGDVHQALVFTRTRHAAKRMAKSLDAQGHLAAALHGDMSQAARKRTVEQMRRDKVRVLVATDVAARGLDIRSISHVINFDLPAVAEDYIHRIGRTGRATDSGTAISLVAPGDDANLASIEKLIGQRLARDVIAGLEAVERRTASTPVSKRKPKSRPRPHARPAAGRGSAKKTRPAARFASQEGRPRRKAA